MATRGRRPDPKNKASRPASSPPAASNPGRGRPEPPAHLSVSALAEWTRVADLLGGLRLLTVGDGPLLDAYADAWDRARLAREAMNLHGMVIETDLGGVKTNPAANIEGKARDQMIRCLIEMGLTPAARSRVAAQAEPERDRMAIFLENRAKNRAKSG